MAEVDNKYKLVGELKKYAEDGDSFTKYHDVNHEFYNEINGYECAIKASLPVPTIRGVCVCNKSITFQKIVANRLDQLDRIDESYLNIVRLCGKDIARLHTTYWLNKKPNYDLQKERLTRLQIDLCNFGNIPTTIKTSVIKQICDRFDLFNTRIHQSTLIHGDFIPQNIFCVESGSDIIIFDWENSCFSDPIYDLATFVSFSLIKIVKSDYHTLQDICLIEEALLEGYCQHITICDDDLKRMTFFKFFGHHCMYWYYLFLIYQFGKRFNDNRTNSLLKGALNDSDTGQLIKDISEENIFFKKNSIRNICSMLKRGFPNRLEKIQLPDLDIFLPA